MAKKPDSKQLEEARAALDDAADKFTKACESEEQAHVRMKSGHQLERVLWIEAASIAADAHRAAQKAEAAFIAVRDGKEN